MFWDTRHSPHLRWLLGRPSKSSMCPCWGECVCQGPVYKPEKAAHLQGRSSAGASLGSEARLDSGPAPPPEALATRGLCVGTQTATGSPARASYVVGAVQRAAAQGAQGQGPLAAKLARQRKEQINARASPHSDMCCERDEQHAHCAGSFYTATWLGHSAQILGYSGCCCEAVFR